MRAQRRLPRDAAPQGLRGTHQGFQMSTARLLGKCNSAEICILLTSLSTDMPPPFICRLDTLDITCLTLIVFVIVVMNEIVSLVPRALYLIDWTAVSDT
jgi:hypothetical protein